VPNETLITPLRRLPPPNTHTHKERPALGIEGGPFFVGLLHLPHAAEVFESRPQWAPLRIPPRPGICGQP